MGIRDNAAFWNKRSEIFDGQVAVTYEEAYRKTIDNTKKYIKNTDRLLDIGCGTGITTIPLAFLAARTVAVDTSPQMLEILREKAARSGLLPLPEGGGPQEDEGAAEAGMAGTDQMGTPSLEILQGDLFSPDLAPSSFNVITAFNVLLYLPDQDRSFSRICELLKPGGYICAAADCLKFSFSGEAIRKWWRSRMGQMPFVKFYTPAELEKCMVSHGFRILETEKLFRHPVNHFVAAQKV